MADKKILITGGLGFLGYHCVEHWSSLESEITVIDDLSTNAVSKNKEIYKDRARRHSKKQIESNRNKLIEYLSGKACVDCGENDPVVLHFDHVRGKKDYGEVRNVGLRGGGHSVFPRKFVHACRD